MRFGLRIVEDDEKVDKCMKVKAGEIPRRGGN